jgi:L-methionine (R)-S-oxide reductase
MAEAFNERHLAVDRSARYREVCAEAASVLEGEPNLVARMATIVSMLKNSFDHYFWAGFYFVDAARHDELVVGPYQGTLGCLRIRFGRGVCGACAATKEVQLVPNVHAFEGHIACDGKSQSELVMPVLAKSGALLAVFDVDATTLSAFDQRDVEGLRAILALVAA